MIKDKSFDFCLLIPCYNNFEGLILSISSVNYYPGRFMILVVDDGSKDPVTAHSVKSKMQNDFTIFVLRNDTNKGITVALNEGLKWIEENTIVSYIARLDCGDICRQDRFYKQMDYLAHHSDVGLLGSWCVFENKTSSLNYQYKTPTEHKQIKRGMHFRNLFIHPTVIFRTDLLKEAGYYPHNFIYTEDYAFFWQLLKISQSHILNEFLVTCEINDKGISLKNRKQQLISRGKTVMHYGTNPLLKIAGLLRLYILFLLPKGLLSFLRKNAVK